MKLTKKQRVRLFCVLGKSLVRKDVFGNIEFWELGELATYIGRDIRISKEPKS